MRHITIMMVVSTMLASIEARAAGAENLEVLYPVPYVLIQRDTPMAGTLRIRGRYPTDVNAGRIEARFCGRAWQVLDPNPKDGVFAGSLRESPGQGDLEVRATAAALTATVACVGVGDLFVVTGQSNADGRGRKHVALDSKNAYLGVKFRHNTWSPGGDPSANDTDDGSPWPRVLNELISEQGVPIGYIQAAVGSTVVRQWRKGGSMFGRMLQIVKAATDGTMNVKAVLYYQGENDITHHNTLSVLGDFTAYHENLLAAVADFHQDLNCPVLVGQITNLLADRNRNDNVRRAQQRVWTEGPHARPGAVVYDIFPTDGVHYRDDANMQAFAGRWTHAIRASVYGVAESENPKLQRAVAVDATMVVITFDRNLKIETWDGKPGTKAFGFSFQDGEVALIDQDVVSTAVSGPQVTVTLGRPLPPGARLFYGSGADGQGKATLRDATTGLPVQMIFDAPLR
ncbi:MAG: sialate O-acetylesterase [Rhodopirellula sp.]|nr:sialate O-acetylesterase [Rhodopirellula sp.]